MRRGAALLALVVLMSAVLGSGFGGEPASAADLPTEGVGSLADCVATRGALLVLFLIDESGSLKETDPTNRRVDAINAALRGFDSLRASIAGVPGRQLDVDVAFAGFSDGYARVGDWTRLTAGNEPQLEQLAAAFASRNEGQRTDYQAALDGGLASFAARSAEVPTGAAGAPCKVALWVTDGRYDTGSRTLENQGRTAICAAGGVADRLRADGVHVFVTALSAPAAPIPPLDQTFLQSVAEGSAAGTTCGTVPIPRGRVPGKYFAVTDVGALISGLFDAVSKIRNGTALEPSEVRVCPRVACPEGTVSFTVDAGLSAFNLLSLTGTDGIEVEIRAPRAKTPVVIAPGRNGEARAGSASLRWSWLERDAVVVDAALPTSPADWVGKWQATFIDRTGTSSRAIVRTQIHVFADLEPVLVAPKELRRGEESLVEVRLDTHAGAPPARDVFAAVAVSVRVEDPATATANDVPMEREAPNRFRGQYLMPLDTTSSLVNLSVRVQPVTRSGLALSPIVRTTAVPVGAPSSYPQVGPSQLVLSSVSGDGTAAGALRIRGGDAAGGCVWVESSHFSSRPAGVDEVALTVEPAARSRESCMKVPPGGAATLDVSVAPSAAADGTVSGVVRVRVISAANPDAAAVDIPTSFAMFRPVDEGRRLTIVASLLIAGIVLPLLLMLLLNWWLARFGPPAKLRVAWIPLLITDEGLMRRDTAAPLDPDPEDFRQRPGGAIDRVRRFDADGVRLRAQLTLLSTPFGVASKPGAIVFGDAGDANGEGDGVKVPLRLGGTWLVVCEQDEIERAAEGARGAVEPSPAATPVLHTGEELRHPLRVKAHLLGFAQIGSASQHITAISARSGTRAGGIVASLRKRVDAARATRGPTRTPSETPWEPPPRPPGVRSTPDTLGEMPAPPGSRARSGGSSWTDVAKPPSS